MSLRRRLQQGPLHSVKVALQPGVVRRLQQEGEALKRKPPLQVQDGELLPLPEEGSLLRHEPLHATRPEDQAPLEAQGLADRWTQIQASEESPQDSNKVKMADLRWPCYRFLFFRLLLLLCVFVSLSGEL